MSYLMVARDNTSTIMMIEVFAATSDLVHKCELDRAILLAYYSLRFQHQQEFTVKNVAEWFHRLGFARPNESRLRQNLSRSKSVIRGRLRTSFRLHVAEVQRLDRVYQTTPIMAGATFSEQMFPSQRSLVSEIKEFEVHDMTSIVFIGHGRSLLWREVKDFLQDDLKLGWDEFNRVPAAGFIAPQRLQDMLRIASFAVLIMTAEDEHSDKTRHARENVIHEIGLFQGRLGYEEAILLLEEGCSTFSNIHGLQYIEFPTGNIQASFHQLRRVLQREGLIE